MGIITSITGPLVINKENSSDHGFPFHIMAGVAGDFTDLYSSYLEVPGTFLFMAFLTCLGSVLAGRLTLESELKPDPRLFTILLGQSADDRKSTAISKTTEFFKEALGDKFNVCMGVGSAEGLQRILTDNNMLLLCFDEFKQFTSKCSIQNSALLPCTTTLFESNKYESRTSTRHVKLENVYLSMLAASTVQTYENTWESSFTDIGFNNRLFLVPGSGERRFSIPPKIPDIEKLVIQARVMELIRFSIRNPELPITQEALELYHNWYINQERSIHSKRLDTYSLRLMILLTANERREEVDEEIVKKAIALCDWQLAVRKLHDPIDADNRMAKLEEKIRRHLAIGPLSDRDLRRKISADRSGIWFYRTALENLLKTKEVRQHPKSRVWELVG
jgi:hypothetical protein